jgi:sucrose-6-phosphate hydrolase SacC (GH32 family)
MSDPNGLVHYKGVYHLFFQHDAEAEVPGNMSWGTLCTSRPWPTASGSSHWA